MPIDTSMYTTKLEDPVNLLTGLTAATGQMQQNRKNNQEFFARQAIGQAYQGAIDPQTGQLDTNKLLSTVANDPRAAYMTGEVAQQAQARQHEQINIAKAQQDLSQARQAALNNLFGPIAADPKATQADLYKAVSEGYKHGVIPPDMAMDAIQNTPSDPAEFRTWVNRHVVQAQSPEKQADLALGVPQMVQTGGNQQPVTVSPTQGVRAIGAPIQNTLTAAELAEPVSWPTPGNPTVLQYGTRAQQLQALGGGGVTPAAIGPAASPAEPAPGAEPLDGRYHAAPTGGPITGAAPGAAEAAIATAGENAKQGMNLQTTADQVPIRKAALGGMLADLQQFTSGPGADWSRFAGAAANRLAQTAGFNGIDTQGIASQEGFTKLGKQIAMQQSQSLGAGTDEKLTTALGANPNTDLSKLGNTQIIHLLQGNEDAIAAKNQEWQKYQAANGPQSYGKFSTEFNKAFDPRVFQMNYMSPPERKAVLDSMSKPDQKSFIDAYRAAKANGWADYSK